MTGRGWRAAFAVAAAVGMGPVPADAEPIPMGSVGTVGLAVDGRAVPAGTTLLSPTVVSTGKTSGWIWLGSEQPTQVVLGQRSSVELERLRPGGFQIAVRTGGVMLPFYSKGGEKHLSFGAGAVLRLDEEQEPPIGEGARVTTDDGDHVDLCELCDPEREECVKPPIETVELCIEDWKDDACRWIPIEVEQRTVDVEFLLLTPMDRLALAGVFDDKPRLGVRAYGGDPPLDVTCSCPPGILGCRPLVVLAAVGGVAVLAPPEIRKKCEECDDMSPTRP